jgi:hypothetical protein
LKLRFELNGVAESPMVQIATIAESRPGSLKLCYRQSDMPTRAIVRDILLLLRASSRHSRSAPGGHFRHQRLRAEWR